MRVLFPADLPSRRLAAAALVATAISLGAPAPGRADLPPAPQPDAPRDATAGSDICALAPPTLSRLGFAAAPRGRSNDAQRALARAERSVARNDFAAACGEIARLVEVDFVAFAPRFEDDKALSKLRASAAGATLQAHVDAVGALWRQAARTGLPAIIADGARGEMEISQPRRLRAGVYVHETGRFLPLERGVSGASAALVDPGAGTVTVVKPIVSACGTDFCPRITSAQIVVFSIDDWRRPPRRWRYGTADSIATEIDVRDDAGGTSVSVHDCCCWRSCRSPWTPVESKRAVADTKAASSAIELFVDFRGALLGVSPAGHRFQKGRLSVDGAAEISLDRAHGDPAAVHAILLDERDGTRLVFSVTDHCECTSKQEDAVFSYVASTIDKAGKATVIFHGAGTGAALLDGARAVYVQIGSTVRRWPSIAEMGRGAGTPIMPGILLVPPRTSRRDCCGL